MLELVIISVIIAIILAGSFNPFLWLRKLTAALGYTIGAAPKGIELARAKAAQWRAEANEELAQQGKLHEKTLKVFKDKGTEDSEKLLNPLISEARSLEAESIKRLKDSLAKMKKQGY